MIMKQLYFIYQSNITIKEEGNQMPDLNVFLADMAQIIMTNIIESHFYLSLLSFELFTLICSSSNKYFTLS